MQNYETTLENVAINRKKIAKTLLRMSVGEKTDFDIIQLDTVRTGVQRLQQKFKAIGIKWSTTTEGTQILVTREA